jgi:hypothetical protein
MIVETLESKIIELDDKVIEKVLEGHTVYHFGLGHDISYVQDGDNIIAYKGDTIIHIIPISNIGRLNSYDYMGHSIDEQYQTEKNRDKRIALLRTMSSLVLAKKGSKRLTTNSP